MLQARNLSSHEKWRCERALSQICQVRPYLMSGEVTVASGAGGGVSCQTNKVYNLGDLTNGGVQGTCLQLLFVHLGR